MTSVIKNTKVVVKTMTQAMLDGKLGEQDNIQIYDLASGATSITDLATFSAALETSDAAKAKWDEIKAYIRKRTGWLIPFHLQLLFATLREHVSDRRPMSKKVTTADVDIAYEHLLSPEKRTYFDFWEQRLHEELGAPDDRQAIDLLDTIARNPEGEPDTILKSVLDKHFQDGAMRDEKLRYLLDILRGDGYLVESGGRSRALGWSMTVAGAA
jgi:hypothetical protein